MQSSSRSSITLKPLYKTTLKTSSEQTDFDQIPSHLTHMLHKWKRILSTQITAIKRCIFSTSLTVCTVSVAIKETSALSQNHPDRGWKLAINQRLVWDKIQTMSESYWCPSHNVTAAAAYCRELPSALWRASLQQFVLVSWTTASLVGLFSSVSR